MTDQKPPTQSPAPTKQRTHFELGEVVYLKSGSPAMTVREVIPNGQVKVTWLAQAHGLYPCVQEASFPRECLTDQDPRLQSLKDAILSSSAELRMPQSQALYMDSERVIRVELTGLQEVLSLWLNRPSSEGAVSQVSTAVSDEKTVLTIPIATEKAPPLYVDAARMPPQSEVQPDYDRSRIGEKSTPASAILGDKNPAPQPSGIQPIKRRT